MRKTISIQTIAYPILLFFISSCFPVKSSSKLIASTTHCENCYSLDPLPDNWKTSPKTLKNLDQILSNSVKQLYSSRSCLKCHASFQIGLEFDSIEVFSKTYDQPNSNKSGPEQFSYTAEMSYTFQGFLTVMNENENLIARILVVNPDEDRFISKTSFSTPTRKIETTIPGKQRTFEDIEISGPAAYISKLNPANEQLTIDLQGKLQKISDRIEKLLEAKLISK